MNIKAIIAAIKAEPSDTAYIEILKLLIACFAVIAILCRVLVLKYVAKKDLEDVVEATISIASEPNYKDMTEQELLNALEKEAHNG